MTSGVKLRDYQKRTLGQVAEALQQRSSVLVIAPTGAGKGTMAVALLTQLQKLGRRGLFLVHRREIVHDVHERLLREGLTAGLMLSGHEEERDRLIQVASIQTLLTEKNPGTFALCIVDEAHHYLADEWGEFVERINPDRLVGFTATPMRSDGRLLSDMFEEFIEAVSYRELRDRGLIVPARVLRPECPLRRTDIAQDPVTAYQRYAKGSRALFFVATLKAAEEVKERLDQLRIPNAIISAKTRHKERREAVEGFARGTIDVIVNFYTMTEGVDLPVVSTIVIARNVSHEAAYVQMIGRALRPHPDKTEALILDLSGASFQHGLPTEDRHFVGCEERDPRRSPETVHRRLGRTPGQVIGLDLIEATSEQQERWKKRRIAWGSVGLGLRSDRSLSRELGVSTDTVARIRMALGIEAIRPPAHGIDWDAEPLGKVPDKEIAQRLHVRDEQVAVQRRKRGIPAFHQGRGIQRTDIDWDSLPLGKVGDKELSRQLGVAQSTVHRERNRRGITAYGTESMKHVHWKDPRVWAMNDEDIAHEFKVQLKSVQRARRRFAKREGREPPPMRVPVDWSKVTFDKPDAMIAKKLGVSPFTVADRRRERGIMKQPGRKKSMKK